MKMTIPGFHKIYWKIRNPENIYRIDLHTKPTINLNKDFSSTFQNAKSRGVKYHLKVVVQEIF